MSVLSHLAGVWHLPGLPGYGLILFRVIGLLFVAPGLATFALPPWVRGLVALWLAAVLWTTLPTGHTLPGSWLLIPGALVNLGIGLAMGLVLSVPLYAWAQAGTLLIQLMGLGLVPPNTPGVSMTPTGLSGWLAFLILAAFLTTGGLPLLLLALHASFQAWPLAHAGLPHSTVAMLAGVLGSILATSLTVAAPALAAGVAGLVTAGLVGRVMPQAPIYFVATPAVIGAVLVVMLLVTPVWLAWAPAMWQTTWMTLSHWMAVAPT